MRWIVLHNGREAGPFSPDQLRELVLAKKIRPEHVMHTEGDTRLFKAADTTLFATDTPRDSSGRIPSGTTRPVNIETGFQPAPYGSLRPSDGYLGGILRVATSVPALGLVAVVLAVIVVGAILLGRSDKTQPKPKEVATNATSPAEQKNKLNGQVEELNTKIRKWQESRDKLGKLVAQLQSDRQAILERLDKLGVSSDSDLAKSPRARVLSDELTDVLQQHAVYQKKHEEYDLAIFRSESRLRTIERRIAAQDAGLGDKEIEELTRSMITLDESLASEQDVGQIARPSLHDALVKELAAYRESKQQQPKPAESTSTIYLYVDPSDARVVVTGSGVKLEGEGRYRKVTVTSPKEGETYKVVATFDGYESFSSELRLAAGKFEYLTITLTKLKETTTVAASSLKEPPPQIPAEDGWTYLATLPHVSVDSQFGRWSNKGEAVLGGQDGRPLSGQPFIFQGKHSARGIYLHPISNRRSHVTYQLRRQFSTFRADAFIPVMSEQQGQPASHSTHFQSSWRRHATLEIKAAVQQRGLRSVLCVSCWN